MAFLIYSGEDGLKETVVEYAIELKYPSPWHDILSPKSLVSFEKLCANDCVKLLSKAINFDSNINTYFFAFRLTDKIEIQDVRKIFNNIKWGDINYCYAECYADNFETNRFESKFHHPKFHQVEI